MAGASENDPIRHVELAIETPSGTWPTEGFFMAPAWQHVERQLKHATRELQIDDTSGWEATAGGKNWTSARASGRTGSRAVSSSATVPARRRSAGRDHEAHQSTDQAPGSNQPGR